MRMKRIESQGDRSVGHERAGVAPHLDPTPTWSRGDRRGAFAIFAALLSQPREIVEAQFVARELHRRREHPSNTEESDAQAR